MKTTTAEKVHSEVTILRPNGETEVVIITGKHKRLCRPVFEEMKRQTAAAGKGELISFEVIRETFQREMTTEEQSFDDYNEQDHAVKMMMGR